MQEELREMLIEAYSTGLADGMGFEPDGLREEAEKAVDQLPVCGCIADVDLRRVKILKRPSRKIDANG